MTFPTLGQRPLVRTGIPSVRLTIVPRLIGVTRGIQWGLSILAIGAGLLTGWMWWNIQALDEEAARYATAAERTDAFNRRLTAQLSQEHLTLSAQQITAIQEELLFVNQLAGKREFSWTQLLHDLEETLPAGTSISKIQRDAKHATITLDGRATEMSALNTLMSALQSRAHFRAPVLHQHTFVSTEHPNGSGEREASGVEFSLTVQYQDHPEQVPTDDVS